MDGFDWERRFRIFDFQRIGGVMVDVQRRLVHPSKHSFRDCSTICWRWSHTGKSWKSRNGPVGLWRRLSRRTPAIATDLARLVLASMQQSVVKEGEGWRRQE